MLSRGRAVVVTGIGIIAPSGKTVPSLWSSLLRQQSFGVVSADLRFRVLPGVVAPVSDEYLSTDNTSVSSQPRFIRFAVDAATAALTHANLCSDDLDVDRAGVAIGVGMASLEDITSNFTVMKERGERRVSPKMVPRLLVNMASAHVSMVHNLRGPSIAPSTACASGANAIGDAATIIANGAADIMLAGGAEACIDPLAIAGFAKCRALATGFENRPSAASRPFDRDRSGFVMSEGSVVLVLEAEEVAKQRSAQVLARVRGYGISSDAFHVTCPPEDGEGAKRAMLAAISDAGINAEQVGYVNAHATSTPAGDAAEAHALASIFPSSRLAVSSTKGSTGHLIGAAGAIEAAATILALHHQVMPPNTNLDNVGDDVRDALAGTAIELIQRATQADHLEAAISNSFGFGGHNVSLLFTREHTSRFADVLV